MSSPASGEEGGRRGVSHPLFNPFAGILTAVPVGGRGGSAGGTFLGAAARLSRRRRWSGGTLDSTRHCGRIAAFFSCARRYARSLRPMRKKVLDRTLRPGRWCHVFTRERTVLVAEAFSFPLSGLCPHL